jgi:hypothetical protein
MIAARWRGPGGGGRCRRFPGRRLRRHRHHKRFARFLLRWNLDDLAGVARYRDRHARIDLTGIWVETWIERSGETIRAFGMNGLDGRRSHDSKACAEHDSDTKVGGFHADSPSAAAWMENPNASMKLHHIAVASGSG